MECVPALPRPSVIAVDYFEHAVYADTAGATHFPQDSSCKNVRKYFATSTIQDCSSITTMPPEPTIEPTSRAHRNQLEDQIY